MRSWVTFSAEVQVARRDRCASAPMRMLLRSSLLGAVALAGLLVVAGVKAAPPTLRGASGPVPGCSASPQHSPPHPRALLVVMAVLAGGVVGRVLARERKPPARVIPLQSRADVRRRRRATSPFSPRSRGL